MEEWVKSVIPAITSESLKVLSDSLCKNAENASGAGLVVRVTRTYDGVGLKGGISCQWCLDRCVNDMEYHEAYDKGVFERHPGCGCIIEYTSKRGTKTYQTGKSGRDNWLSESEFQRRVNYGLNNRPVTPSERLINAAIEMQARDTRSITLINAIVENHDALKYYSPTYMKKRLERAGLITKPLTHSKSGFNGLTLEEGGGFKVLFGGDGIFQYHPAEGRHKIAYWKVNNGKAGLKHYGTDGAILGF